MKEVFDESTPPKIVAVEFVFNSNFMSGLRLFYQNGHEVESVGRQGKEPYPHKTKRFELEGDEYIVKVRGKFNMLFENLVLVTSKGRYLTPREG